MSTNQRQHPTKVCLQCSKSGTKADSAKRQWKREQPVCPSCAESTNTAAFERPQTKTCIQCSKECDRGQFPQKQWKRERPLCRLCFELTKISKTTSRKCRQCKLDLPRDAFNVYQWGKGDEALCGNCSAQVEEKVLSSIGTNSNKDLPDGTTVCSTHSLEHCDVCMVDFTLPNQFARKRTALGRDLTKDEYEEISKAFFEGANITINRKVCIMDGLAVCPRSGRKLRCPCNEVNYCSKECQKAHWVIHKMTCKDFAEKQKAKKEKAAKKSQAAAAAAAQTAHGLTEEQLNNIRIEAFFAENSGVEHAIEECAWQLGEHPFVIGGGSVKMTRDGKQEFTKGDVAKIYMEKMGAVWDGSPRFGMPPYVQQKEPFDWIAKARQGKSQRELEIEKFLRGH